MAKRWHFSFWYYRANHWQFLLLVHVWRKEWYKQLNDQLELISPLRQRCHQEYDAYLVITERLWIAPENEASGCTNTTLWSHTTFFFGLSRSRSCRNTPVTSRYWIAAIVKKKIILDMVGGWSPRFPTSQNKKYRVGASGMPKFGISKMA